MYDEVCTLVVFLQTMETVCDGAGSEGSPWFVFVLLLNRVIRLRAQLHRIGS